MRHVRFYLNDVVCVDVDTTPCIFIWKQCHVRRCGQNVMYVAIEQRDVCLFDIQRQGRRLLVHVLSVRLFSSPECL